MTGPTETPTEISADDRRILACLFDRVIPADRWPAASDAAVFEHLDTLRLDPATAGLVDLAVEAGRTLEAEARARHGDRLGELDDETVDRLLTDAAGPPVDVLLNMAIQAYYGAADSPGAAMVGFVAAGKRDAGAPVVEPALTTTAFAEIDASWDAMVLGAGAGGGIAACVLAEAGARVLLVDRGEALRFDEVGRDHLRNHRLAVYGHNTGPAPEGNPRMVEDHTGTEHVIAAPFQTPWHNNAMTVGGGTRVYQGMAWRFLPDDFAMASRYGVPAGSSLADWPISYDDLEPHYAAVEWELGVCGDGDAHPVRGTRSRRFPMPPLPPNAEAEVLRAGARSLGLATGPVPMLINSAPYNGRARCVQCGECVGFACPSDAKTGTHNTVIPRALATGNCALVTRCRAVEVLTDPSGRVSGARLLDERTGEMLEVRASDVVVACGAIETARLLLASRSHHHPDGLGNHGDQVGRHLQGHPYTGAFGLFDEPVQDLHGPGVSIATCDHNHDNPDVIGGGVIANEVIKLPILHWYWALPPDAPRWGLAGKAAMRHAYRRTGHLFGPIQEIPRAENRVTLADGVTDGFGLPVARFRGAAHAETLRTAAHQRQVAVAWLEASGATRTWTEPDDPGLSAGQHQAGTCRMGADPATSVTDPGGRVHGHDNLWVADASVHVTNGGFNPVLTIMALARRTAGRLVATR